MGAGVGSGSSMSPPTAVLGDARCSSQAAMSLQYASTSPIAAGSCASDSSHSDPKIQDTSAA